MAKKQAAAKEVAKGSTSSEHAPDGAQKENAMRETPAPLAAVAPEPKTAPAPKTASPEGWVRLPLELRAFWTPLYSKRPLEGVLIAQAKLDVEGISVLAFRLTAETDVLLPTGEIAIGKIGQEVLVPQFYSLGAVAQLLSRQDLFYQVFIGNPERVEVAAADGSGSIRLWNFDIVANPQGIPRASFGAR
jgi:hypothetical protein